MFALTKEIQGMQVIEFNTFAPYTVIGQLIYATVLPTGNISMVDVSRGVEYIFDKNKVQFNAESIDLAYKRNCYDNDFTAPHDINNDAIEYRANQDFKDTLREYLDTRLSQFSII
jgi:hypothetical protein